MHDEVFTFWFAVCEESYSEQLLILGEAADESETEGTGGSIWEKAARPRDREQWAVSQTLILLSVVSWGILLQ